MVKQKNDKIVMKLMNRVVYQGQDHYNEGRVKRGAKGLKCIWLLGRYGKNKPQN